jgi:hypothetical protein
MDRYTYRIVFMGIGGLLLLACLVVLMKGCQDAKGSGWAWIPNAGPKGTIMLDCDRPDLEIRACFERALQQRAQDPKTPKGGN